MYGASWGGSEACWAAAAERLARHGVRVAVSVNHLAASAKQIQDLRLVGCQVFFRSDPSLPVRMIRKLPPWREQFRRHVKKIGAGAGLIVVSQGANIEGLDWMEACRANGYSYASIAQGAAEMLWPGDDTTQRLALCYEHASAAYFVSEANLALSRRQFGIPLPNGRVIRNPFNVRYDARPAWPSAPSDELRLACIGRLDAHQKGQDILFQVLDLPHWRQRNVRVTLVGNGHNANSLRRWAAELQLRGVTFAGFTENIEEIWVSHHALVLPSRFEGMPLVLVEAMLCGRPAIITDVAGARELVRDNVNGFLAKAPTVELVDEAMNRAWENRHRLKEMGEQASIDARKFVGPDPVEDFVRELFALVESPASVTESAPQRTLEASQILTKEGRP